MLTLLNLGCGATRPQDAEWKNIDTLYSLFPKENIPERIQLDSEKNYVNHDLRNPLPFEDNSIDGILASQLIEHFDCHEALRLFRECHRVLKRGGVFRVSIPDARTFHQLSVDDFQDWGEANRSDGTFMEYALFFMGHKQILSIDALNCLFWLARFNEYKKVEFKESSIPKLASLDNRKVFSLFMEGKK